MTSDLRPDRAEEDLADQIDNIVPTHGYRRVPVVGLGGSAGSIEALQSFFRTMPPTSGLAFVVVIHLSSTRESALSEVIQRCTRMNVVQVTAPVQAQVDTVYVIPPGNTLEWKEGRLSLGELPEGRKHVVVDVFFRALADSHGAHAAAVVLSGLDSDGSIGARRVKERGGLTVAQDPEEALHGGMPRSAIATGMVDWVLPVQDMPARLLSYFRLERAVALPPEDGPSAHEQDERQLGEVLSFLRTRTGRDFAHYKRATVLRRIGRRMQVNGVDNLVGYLTCLRTRPGECKALLQDLLISVTNFFRDAECFAALEERIPLLFAGKGANDAVRVWVVACATGEEAYSVAMLLSEHARTLEAPPAIQVFATDLDQEAVQVAREGVYPSVISADVSEERLRRHFVRDHGGYRVRRELRETVLFAVHDVLRDSPFSRLDLVTCRNLLIYLTREAQARVFATLHFALIPNGTLFVGSSESVDDNSPLFTVVDKKRRIFAQRPASRNGLPAAQVPSTLTLALESHLGREGPVLPLHAFDPAANAALLPHTQASRREPPRSTAWADMHLQLLEQLAPPSVLVDAVHDIVHLSPSVGRYLQLAGGEPSRNLLRALQPELRIDVRAALLQAAQLGREVQLPSVRVALAGGSTLTRIRVLPSEPNGQRLFLILFDTDLEGTAGEGGAAQVETDPMALHLDAEIERMKMHLRETVEQYEASSEELKASNEELQAMNEELRAATEELQTSREELQSINEELATVNHELKNKVEQLSHANSDLQNLMDATQIATIFLDRNLRIMRFTPAAVRLFNLIPTDLGRPLSDMGTQLDYPELGDDAMRVLQRLVPIEREVGQPDGTWYLARLIPYRTADDRIAGVVFTFIDITERKRAEEVRLWLSAVVSASSDAIISFALDETILSWNAGAQKLFGYGPEEAIGQPLSMLSAGDPADTEHLLAEVAAGRGLANVETVRRRKDGSTVHVAMTVSPVRESDGRVQAATAIARDFTAVRAAAEALRQSEERLRLIMENAREYAIFSLDLERRVTSWNAGAQRLLGYAQEEVLGRSGDMLFTAEDQAARAPEKEAVLARQEGRAADDRTHVRQDGTRFPANGVLMLMRNDAGDAVGFVKILRDLSRDIPRPKD